MKIIPVFAIVFTVLAIGAIFPNILETGAGASIKLPDGASSRCAKTKERGPCDKYELRFYYEAALGYCKYFLYGGCEPNGNNFKKLEDCQQTCVSGSETTTKIPTTNIP